MPPTPDVFQQLLRKLNSNIKELTSPEASKEVSALQKQLLALNTPQTKWVVK